MSFAEIYQQFFTDIYHTAWYEYVAVFSGIISVWFSKRENVLVFPIGLINTIIYIYISIKGHLLGEASVNFYYTIMSFLGWYLWLKKDPSHKPILNITVSTNKERVFHFMFFITCYLIVFFALRYFKQAFFDGVIPWADAFASASAFTGMWLMTKKKMESWYWWIATNIASIPLYFVKHYVFTSIYYVVLLLLSFAGLYEWIKKSKQNTIA